MNIQDIHILIEQGLQNIGIFVYPNITHEEIDIQFNRVVETYISEILKEDRDNDGDSKSYQINQDSIDALRVLEVVDFELTNLAVNSRFGRADLPTNYRNKIQVRAEITYTCNSVVTTDTVEGRVIKRSELSNILKHPYGKTDKENPVASISSGNVYVYRDESFNISRIFLDYLKKPTKVKFAVDENGDFDNDNSIHCEFPDEVCYDLVDKTVSRLANLTEQSQQKIINIENEKIA